MLSWEPMQVAGWRPGAGRRERMIGAVVLGAYDDRGRLVHIGDVGTGFTDHALCDVADRLRPLARNTSPLDEPPPAGYARDARWVQPVLVGDVAYRTQSADQRLQHPSWRGLAPTGNPTRCTVLTSGWPGRLSPVRRLPDDIAGNLSDRARVKGGTRCELAAPSSPSVRA